jgi:hypothetical protein
VEEKNINTNEIGKIYINEAKRKRLWREGVQSGKLWFCEGL